MQRAIIDTTRQLEENTIAIKLFLVYSTAIGFLNLRHITLHAFYPESVDPSTLSDTSGPQKYRFNKIKNKIGFGPNTKFLWLMRKNK